MKMTRVLLIDKDVVDGDHIGRLFNDTNEQVRIHHLNSSESVDEYFTARQFGAPHMDIPSLIILDVDFPNALEGLDLLEKMSKMKNLKDVPIFIFTNNADKAIVANCYVRGANGYFLKPTENTSLPKAVKMLNERWQNIIQRGFGYNYKAV